MKILFYLPFLVSIIFSSKIFSQNIYLNYQERSLQDILIELNEDYNIEVSVNSKLSSKCKITINQNTSSIDQALEICANYCNLKVVKIGDVYTFKKIKIKEKKFLFQGALTDKKTGECLPNSKITVGENNIYSDEFGRFSFLSNRKNQKIKIQHLGYYILDTTIEENNKHLIALSTKIKLLDEVEVLGETNNTICNTTIGNEIGLIELNKIGSQFIPGINNNIVFNNLRMYPGVMAAGESTSNYIIWGGYPGQGLITFDGITLFSSSGMNGNMGRVNSHIINSIHSYKGGYNVDIGDRTGAAVIINGKEGSNYFNGELSVDNQMTSGYLNIPMFNNSSSLQIAGRVTYFELLKSEKENLKLSNDFIYPNYSYSDLNIKFTSTLKNEDKIQISSILSSDKQSSLLDKKDLSSYYSNLNYESNQIGNSVNYLKNWTKGGMTKILISQSHFMPNERYESRYSDTSTSTKYYFSGYKNGINEYNLKLEHSFPSTKNNELKFAVFNTYNSCNYNSIEGISDFTNYNSSINRISAYVKDKIVLWSKLNIQLGLKSDFFNNKIYLQPRVNGNLKLSENWHVNYGVGKYNQYISRNQISDSIGTSSYIWLLSDDKHHPIQTSNHNVIGVCYNNDFIEGGIETYYRTINNVGIYSSLNIDSAINTFNVVAQGIDVFSKIKIKKHQVLLSYSIAKVIERSLLSTNEISSEANHSQRHELKSLLNLNFNTISFAFAGIIGSGFRPFDNKNNKIYPYSRIDVALEYRKTKYSLGLSILNLFNSSNTRLFQTSVFYDNSTFNTLGTVFTPTLFLHFRF